ncbi:hypothetical protein [Sorangium sp. So ce1097]
MLEGVEHLECAGLVFWIVLPLPAVMPEGVEHRAGFVATTLFIRSPP